MKAIWFQKSKNLKNVFCSLQNYIGLNDVVSECEFLCMCLNWKMYRFVCFFSTILWTSFFIVILLSIKWFLFKNVQIRIHYYTFFMPNAPQMRKLTFFKLYPIFGQFIDDKKSQCSLGTIRVILWWNLMEQKLTVLKELNGIYCVFGFNLMVWSDRRISARLKPIDSNWMTKWTFELAATY